MGSAQCGSANAGISVTGAGGTAQSRDPQSGLVSRGALFPNGEINFDAVELEVTGLHAFADMPSVYTRFTERGMVPMTFVCDPPDAAAGTTSTPIPGEVKFDPRATSPTLGGPDISVTTDTRLKFKFDGAVQLPAVVADIAIPIRQAGTTRPREDARHIEITALGPDPILATGSGAPAEQLRSRPGRTSGMSVTGELAPRVAEGLRGSGMTAAIVIQVQSPRPSS